MPTKTLTNKRNHILEILLPFLGLAEPYTISAIPVTAIILLLVILFRDGLKGAKLSISKQAAPYLVFVIYKIIRDLFHMAFSISDPISVQFNRLFEDVVLFALIFIVCDTEFSEDVLYKWWKIAGIFFGAGMIYHVVQLLVLKNPIEPISLIPGYIIYNDKVEEFMRPTSFFSEPASYVTSMLPLLFLSLKRKDFKWSVISTFLIVISTSTVGVVLSAVLWIIFILFEEKSLKTTLLSLIFVALFIVLFMNLAIFSDALEKLLLVSQGDSTWGSRVEIPFQMVNAMTWKELPFGTNIIDTRTFAYNNIGYFLKYPTMIDSLGDGYGVFLNTIAYLIFRYGIVGLGLYLLTFKNKLFNKKYEARMYAIIMFVASFAQGSVADPGIAFIILLLYSNRVGVDTNKSTLIDDRTVKM